jgi:hypothetical protein
MFHFSRSLVFALLLVAACSGSPDGAVGDGGPAADPGSAAVTLNGAPLAVASARFEAASTASMNATGGQSQGGLMVLLSDAAFACNDTASSCNTFPDGTYLEIAYAGVATGNYVIGATAYLNVYRSQGGSHQTTGVAVTGSIALDGYAAGHSATGHFDVGLRDGTRAHGSFSAGACTLLTDIARAPAALPCAMQSSLNQCEVRCGACGQGTNVTSCTRPDGGTTWTCTCTAASGATSTCTRAATQSGSSCAPSCCTF